MLALLAAILPGVVLPAFKTWVAGRNAEAARIADERMEARRQRHERKRQAMENAKDIRLATAGFLEMRVLTVAIAFPFVEHLLAVWMDTRFGVYQNGGMLERCWLQGGVEKCGVPAMPAPFDEWQGAIILSFFGLYGGVKAVQYVGASIASRRR